MKRTALILVAVVALFTLLDYAIYALGTWFAFLLLGLALGTLLGMIVSHMSHPEWRYPARESTTQ